MTSSDFISNGNVFDEKVPLGKDGATSLSYKVCKEGRLYFMKQLRPELFTNFGNRALLHKEFALGKSISHGNIVGYHSICENSDELYILMEYVQGCTIEERLENDRGFFMKEHNVWRILLQLLDGLKVLHSKSIAYVDINASNIMLTQVGNNVKIVDLGFCFSNEFSHTLGATKDFAAPEVIEGNVSNIDERSDIYSVGCLMRHISKRCGAKYSLQFKKIMNRCLEADKAKRFATVDEMIRTISRCNRGHKIAIVALAMLAVIAGSVLLTGSVGQNEDTDMVFQSEADIIYRVLSHEEETCEVIGGEGRGGNIYIDSHVTFKGRDYKTMSIADSAFVERDILSVHIPEGVQKIGHAAFFGCDSVVTISLPNTIKEFCNSFINMKSLKIVKFPSKLKTISSSAFVDCKAIETLCVPEGVERIGFDAFGRCYGLKNVMLPLSLKVLERGVFWKCKGLEEITIPATVEEIGDYAFYHCDSLKHIYLYAQKPPAITTILNKSDAVIHVPVTAVEHYKNHPYWAKYNIAGDL